MLVAMLVGVMLFLESLSQAMLVGVMLVGRLGVRSRIRSSQFNKVGCITDLLRRQTRNITSDHMLYYVYVCVCVYLYIYIYVHMYVCMYIYIYIHLYPGGRSSFRVPVFWRKTKVVLEKMVSRTIDYVHE